MYAIRSYYAQAGNCTLGGNPPDTGRAFELGRIAMRRVPVVALVMTRSRMGNTAFFVIV